MSSKCLDSTTLYFGFQLLQGSLLGVSQVIAVNDLACSGLVLAGMLLFSPLLTLAAFAGSLISTFLGKLLKNCMSLNGSKTKKNVFCMHGAPSTKI